MADELEHKMTVGELKAHVDERFDQVDRRFNELERQMVRGHAETRRHFDMVAERLEGHFRLLAERGDVDHQRLEDHETRIRILEKRRR
jgi:hypothetical protein